MFQEDSITSSLFLHKNIQEKNEKKKKLWRLVFLKTGTQSNKTKKIFVIHVQLKQGTSYTYPPAV